MIDIFGGGMLTKFTLNEEEFDMVFSLAFGDTECHFNLWKHDELGDDGEPWPVARRARAPSLLDRSIDRSIDRHTPPRAHGSLEPTTRGRFGLLGHCSAIARDERERVRPPIVEPPR